MYLLGIDVGTSGCKAVIFDPEGNIKANAYRGYTLITPGKGRLELDPEVVFQSVLECFSRLSSQFHLEGVTALSISTQGEAVIPVSPEGNPLHNAILTFDSRNDQEYSWFKEKIGKKELLEITGLPVHPMFSATKILWIRNHLPEVFGQTWKFMCFGDYIAYKLGAEPSIDYSMASRTMLFDLNKKKWSDQILKICDLKPDKLSKPVAAGAVIGKIRKIWTEQFGFSPQLKIVSGSHDQACCCIGSGIIEKNLAMDSMGTTESIVCIDSMLHLTDEMTRYNIPVYPYPATDLYAYMTFLSASASLLKWFQEKITDDDKSDFHSRYDRHLTEHCQEPSGLYILPYFAGSGTPYLDFKSKGVIYGLTLDTDRFQLYKGVMEACCYEAKMNIENMRASGIELTELRCIGGGAGSDLWLQMKADITGKKVVRMDVRESGCLGAAALAGIGTGIYSDIEDSSGKLVRIRESFYPDKDKMQEYQNHYQEYQRMYPVCSRLWNGQGG